MFILPAVPHNYNKLPQNKTKQLSWQVKENQFQNQEALWTQLTVRSGSGQENTDKYGR